MVGSVGPILTDCNRVDHGGNFRDTPTHDEGTNGQMVLKSSSDYHKSTDIEWHSDITCPKVYFEQTIS